MFYRIEKKELNLLAAYNRKEGPSVAEKWIKLLLAPLILVLIFAGSFVWLNASNQRLQNQVDDLKKQNNEIQSQIDTIGLDAYNELTSLESALVTVEKLDAEIKTLPQITKLKILGLELALLDQMKIITIDYDQTTGVLDVSYESVYVTNIEKYVRALKTNPLYSNAIYKGYNRTGHTEEVETGEIDEETGEPVTEESTDYTYSFDVQMTLGGE